MPVNANTKYLQIDTTCICNFLFVCSTMLFDVFFCCCAIGNVTIVLININFIKQLLLHKTMIALNSIGFYGIIFIEVESNYVFKAESIFLMHSYEFSIK